MKTSVYLPEDLKSAPGRVAAERGRSEAEFIGEAVRELVRGSEPSDRVCRCSQAGIRRCRRG